MSQQNVILIERTIEKTERTRTGLFGRIKESDVSESMTERVTLLPNNVKILPDNVKILPVLPQKTLPAPTVKPKTISQSRPQKPKSQKNYKNMNMKLPNCRCHVPKRNMLAKRMNDDHLHLKCPSCGKVALNATSYHEVKKLKLHVR